MDSNAKNLKNNYHPPKVNYSISENNPPKPKETNENKHKVDTVPSVSPYINLSEAVDQGIDEAVTDRKTSINSTQNTYLGNTTSENTVTATGQLSNSKQKLDDDNPLTLRQRKISKLQQASRRYTENSGLLVFKSEGKGANLNLKVPAFAQQNTRIKRRKINKAPVIACRHLADAYVQFKGTISNFLKQLKNKAQLANYLDFKIDLIEEVYASDLVSETGYFFSIDKFQDVIADLVSKNWGKENYEERFKLSTGSHAMAIKITTKNKGKSTKISFFDPNVSDLHVNTHIYDLKDASNLTTTVLADKDISRYFTFGEGVLLSKNLTTEDKCKTKILSDITPSLIELTLKRGHFKSANLGEKINNQFKGDEAFQLYKDIVLEHGGISTTMRFNNNQNLRYLIQSILSSSMSEKQKIELLTRKSALNYAIDKNYKNSIEAFFEEILNSNVLSEEDKYTILSKPALEDNNGMFMAFSENNPEAIEAIAKAVLTSNFSEDQKIELLSIFNKAEAMSVSLFTFRAPESFTAFINAVTKFASEDIKNQIFEMHDISAEKSIHLSKIIVSSSMKDIEEQFSNDNFFDNFESTEEKLAYAIKVMVSATIKHENYSNITNFFRNLLNNDQLTDTEKQQILLESDIKNLLITNFIVEDNKANKASILEIFKSILNDTSISEDQKAKAMLNHQEEPAMKTLLKAGKTELIIEKTAKILMSKSPEKTIINMLQNHTSIGGNWLYEALNSEQDLSEFIDKFTNIVLTSRLSEEAKTLILSPVNHIEQFVSFEDSKNEINKNAFKTALENNNFSNNLINLKQNTSTLKLLLNHAWQSDNQQYLKNVINTIADSELPDDEKIEILITSYLEIDKALEEGRYELITIYICELIKNPKLTYALEFIINAEQMSILENIMMHGNYDFIKSISDDASLYTYKKMIKKTLKSSLLYMSILGLLQLKKQGQPNFLYTALNSQSADSAKKIQFIANQVMNSSFLREYDKISILTPLDSSGKRIPLKRFSETNPSVLALKKEMQGYPDITNEISNFYTERNRGTDLYHACKRRDMNFIKNYIDEAITLYRSDKDKLQKILTTKKSKSVLDMLRDDLDDDMLDYLFDKIINNNYLSEEEKIIMLSNEDSKQQSFLYRLLEKEPTIIVSLTEIVASSKLSESAILKLLQVYNGTNTSWLYDLLNKTDKFSLKALNCYVLAVLSIDNISNEAKLKLLTPINKGSPVALKDLPRSNPSV